MFFVLTGLALSPLYGVLSAEPNFFLAHRSEPMDFIVLTGMISFVFPFVLATVVTLVLYFSGRKQTLGIKIFITFLAAFVLLPIAKKITGGSIPGTVILVVSIGLAFSFAYCKFSGPKLFLNYISPAILVFPILFVFVPQIFVLVVVSSASFSFFHHHLVVTKNNSYQNHHPSHSQESTLSSSQLSEDDISSSK